MDTRGQIVTCLTMPNLAVLAKTIYEHNADPTEKFDPRVLLFKVSQGHWS